MRRNYLELSVRAVARFFVGAPSAKMRHVPEAGALHVLIGDFQHQFRAQRFPRQIFPLAPAALSSGHALAHFGAGECFRPLPPRMILERVFAIGRELFYKSAARIVGETCADADVLQGSRVVK